MNNISLTNQYMQESNFSKANRVRPRWSHLAHICAGERWYMLSTPDPRYASTTRTMRACPELLLLQGQPMDSWKQYFYPRIYGPDTENSTAGNTILALLVVGFGFWMSTHNDECRRSLTVPVIALGGVIFLISLVGFLGAWKNVSCLLWTYLIMLFVVLVAIMVFTVLAFIITNSGSGHTVPGARYKEYRLQDYSSWFVKQLDDTEKWARLKSCLVKTDDCNNLSKRYKTAKEYKLADLTPMESGCCRPPAECGYPALNASYFDLSFHPVSTNVDCKLYKNTRSVRCYDCNSCKAGVAQYMKTEWRVVAIFNVILFVILSFVYFVGCCARRNTGGSDAKGRGR
ncbi:tetraspanin-10 isoform X1 [Sorghum bicolor]|nr:tetraspanin-10 isoform X1 [Sorghum bicolor]XP_021307482.1 tetraspanin-10 isoform X1 [Sorghum bicolor]|eukprot:XP_021307481.1 tetraspanin-10 isoform X1 [Sorghum bicolor]